MVLKRGVVRMLYRRIVLGLFVFILFVGFGIVLQNIVQPYVVDVLGLSIRNATFINLVGVGSMGYGFLFCLIIMGLSKWAIGRSKPIS